MADLLPGDFAQLGYLALLLVFIGGALVFEFAGRRNQAMRSVAAWILIFGIAIAGAGWWMERDRVTVVDGQRIEIGASHDGHFYLTADVNGQPIRFMVDTGASSVFLSQDDARSAGIDPDALTYNSAAITANGRVRTADVRLDSFAVGDIIDNNVTAQVTDSDMDGSLLGLAYLNRYARITLEGDTLILER